MVPLLLLFKPVMLRTLLAHLCTPSPCYPPPPPTHMYKYGGILESLCLSVRPSICSSVRVSDPVRSASPEPLNPSLLFFYQAWYGSVLS